MSDNNSIPAKSSSFIRAISRFVHLASRKVPIDDENLENFR